MEVFLRFGRKVLKLLFIVGLTVVHAYPQTNRPPRRRPAADAAARPGPSPPDAGPPSAHRSPPPPPGPPTIAEDAPPASSAAAGSVSLAADPAAATAAARAAAGGLEPAGGLETTKTTRPVAPGVQLTSFDRYDADGWLRADALTADLAGGSTRRLRQLRRGQPGRAAARRRWTGPGRSPPSTATSSTSTTPVPPRASASATASWSSRRSPGTATRWRSPRRPRPGDRGELRRHRHPAHRAGAADPVQQHGAGRRHRRVHRALGDVHPAACGRGRGPRHRGHRDRRPGGQRGHARPAAARSRPAAPCCSAATPARTPWPALRPATR